MDEWYAYQELCRDGLVLQELIFLIENIKSNLFC